MMPKWRLAVFVILWLVLASAYAALADDMADSKIKNGKLLAERALAASGETRADYIYKAKREFERAALAEPDNPWTYYWQAVITDYLEGDSLGAERLYARALEYKKKKRFDGSPAPWAYSADSDLKSALKDDFDWAKTSDEQPQPLPVEKAPLEKPEPDQIEFLSAMISVGDFTRAESLYGILMQSPENQKKDKLLINGLTLKLAQDSLGQASALLSDIADKKGRRSQAFKTALELYDGALDTALAASRDLERGDNPGAAENILAAWQPHLNRPATPARGRLILQFASVTLAQGRLSAADSALGLYDQMGYEEGSAYKNLKAKLTMAQRTQTPPEAKPELAVARTEKKPEPVSGFVTIAPPQGDIVKVIVNTINPTTGRVESSELWETAAPRQFKTGSAYKLVVQKKQERKAPKYIALAGILATFLIVR